MSNDTGLLVRSSVNCLLLGLELPLVRDEVEVGLACRERGLVGREAGCFVFEELEEFAVVALIGEEAEACQYLAASLCLTELVEGGDNSALAGAKGWHPYGRFAH
jgi:hypothetical protein